MRPATSRRVSMRSPATSAWRVYCLAPSTQPGACRRRVGLFLRQSLRSPAIPWVHEAAEQLPAAFDAALVKLERLNLAEDFEWALKRFRSPMPAEQLVEELPGASRTDSGCQAAGEKTLVRPRFARVSGSARLRSARRALRSNRVHPSLSDRSDPVVPLRPRMSGTRKLLDSWLPPEGAGRPSHALRRAIRSTQRSSRATA